MGIKTKGKKNKPAISMSIQAPVLPNGGPRMSPGAHVMNFLSTMSLILMTVQMIRIWWVPQWGGKGEEVAYCMTVMIAEFFMIHTSFMALGISAIREKGIRLLFWGILMLYAIGGGSLFFYLGRNKDMFFVLSYASVIILRSLSAFKGTEGPDPKNSAMIRSGAGGLFYLIAVFASISIPFPQGAIAGRTASGRGIWNSHPEQLVGAAAVFFLCLTCLEVFLWYRACKKGPAPVAAGDGNADDSMTPMPFLGIVSILLLCASVVILRFLAFPDFFLFLLSFAAIITGIYSRSNAGAISVLLSIVFIIARGLKVLIFGF